MKLFKSRKREEIGINKVDIAEEKGLEVEEKESIKEGSNIDVLIKANELLQYMTQLDYVRDVISEINSQGEMVENVTASSEELSASIDEISNSVQESATATNESIDVSKQSTEEIKEFFNQIEEAMEKTNEVKETMSLVNNEAKKIDEMVVIIKNVADRTNLLALNASIEAARAGEHGKGFTVVSEEIKKLAESTTEQVSFIREVVTSLSNEISKTSTALDKATELFTKSKVHMDKAVGSIDKINVELSGIGHSFVEISANIEEQTAATEEMSGTLVEINQLTSELRNDTIKTGQAFYDISKLVDEIRILAHDQAESIDPKSQIEICISDHLMWKWRVYNMILGFETLSEDAVGNHHTCRLGKWVSRVDSSDVDLMKIIEKLEKPHASLHSIAKDAIRAYNNGNIKEAEKALEMMDSASNEVVKYLNQLKR